MNGVDANVVLGAFPADADGVSWVSHTFGFWRARGPAQCCVDSWQLSPPEVGRPGAEILQPLPEARKDDLSSKNGATHGMRGSPVNLPTGRGVNCGIPRFHPIPASGRAPNDFATTKGRLA